MPVNLYQNSMLWYVLQARPPPVKLRLGVPPVVGVLQQPIHK